MNIMKYPISADRDFIHATTPVTGQAKIPGLRSFCPFLRRNFQTMERSFPFSVYTRYSKGTPYQEKEELDLYTRYNDFIITRLRTTYGIPTHILKETFGETLFDYCMRMASPHLKQGFLTLDNHIMKLTEKGIFISDGIMSDLLWVDD